MSGTGHPPGGAGPLTGLSHVQLRVTDVVASAAWFTSALGLEPFRATQQGNQHTHAIPEPSVASSGSGDHPQPQPVRRPPAVHPAHQGVIANLNPVDD